MLRGVDLPTLGARLAEASVTGLLLACALVLVQNVFRAWRWEVLLAPIRRPLPFRLLFSAIVIGYMFSWVAPGRVGEVVRPLMLSARGDVPLAPALGTVVADRLLDAVSVVVMFAIAVWIAPLPGAAAAYAGSVRIAAAGMALAAFVVLAVLLSAAAHGDALVRLGERYGRVARRVVAFVVSLSAGVAAFRSPRRVALLVVSSACLWICIALSIWVGIRASGATGFTFGQTMFIQPMLVLGIAVPTPGGAGSYHALMKGGLLLFGVAEETAVGAGLLVHAVTIVPIVVLGLALMWIEGLSWRDLARGARRIRELGADERAAAPLAATEEGAS